MCQYYPDSKVYAANMGPTWVLSAPDGPHVGPMNLAIRVVVVVVVVMIVVVVVVAMAEAVAPGVTVAVVVVTLGKHLWS